VSRYSAGGKEIKKRIQMVQHKGVSILYQNFSGLTPGEELTTTLEEARSIVQSQPKGSVLILVDVTGAHYDIESLNRMKDVSASNEPFVKATAIVGIQGLLEIGLTGLSRFTGRSFNTFPTKEKALDWLAAQ
jgi:hypothetical protein